MSDGDVKSRIKIQELVEKNTSRAGGDFHEDNLDSQSFLMDLKNKFKLTPKKSDKNIDELLENLVDSSNSKVIGRFDIKTFRQNIFIKKLFENFEVVAL